MKRILSMLLVVCMVLTPLPSAAAGNTVVVSDYNSLKAALTSSAGGTTVKLDSDISYSNSITVTSSLTLDLNGHTLTFTGTDTEKKILATAILITGSGTFSVKDSGTDGKLITSETYSAALSNIGSGILDLAGGEFIADKEISCAVFNNGNGTLKFSGATVKSEKFYAVINQSTSGKLNMSNGTVSSDSSCAIGNYGMVEISGGTVYSKTGIGVNSVGSSSSVTVSGGNVESLSGYAIVNGGNSSTVTVTGGTVSSESGYAIANFDGCEVKLSGGTVSSISGMGIANMKGGSAVISNGATVNANSGTAIFTNGSLAISGGTVHSDSGTALISYAPAGSEVTVSGGTISSTSSYCTANGDAGKLTISGTAVFSTVSGGVCLLNQGAGTVTIDGGTLIADTIALYNASTGKIEINAGTHAVVINSNESGKIVVNGGSVKTIQGATPTNSAGTPLSSYGITLTDGSAPIAKNTPIAAGELTLTPAVSYGFGGVKTDASGTIYLWLPSAVATANYKSGSIDVSGGITARKTSVLPNYTARVTVKRNGETWNSPYKVLLLNRNDSNYDQYPVILDGGAAKEGGVYEFSGLKPGQDYYIWGKGTTGLLYSGVKITSSAQDATVNFYDLTVTAGDGIDYVLYNATLIQGADTFIQANVKPGYTFDKWTNTTGGELVLDTSSGTIKMDGKKDLTAYATLNIYDGSVTLNKDNSAWINSGKTINLSTSETDEAGVGYQTVSANADGVYSFTDLSPLVTYYVWMDGKYTGQTVTTTNKNVALDYYTVALTSGANIASVSGGGVYLKGTEITVSATAQTGDYVFSRWQNTAGGALVSATNPYTFPVNSAASLNAVSGAAKYIASVTLKKDGADWSTSPRNIVLSTSETELTGTVTGTVTGNTYTFTNLPGTGTYFVWDAQTVTYTGKQISSTVQSAELEYFTVSVTPDSSNASVMGAGTYLKGSSVTLTATPADYYRIDGAGWTDGKFTINNISAAQTVNPAAALDTYTGTVNVKKDNADWTDSTATITLSASSTDADAGKLSTSGASGVFTAVNLDPTKTYYVWADGAYTGQTVTSTVKTAAIVDYYTINVTETNVTVNGKGTFLKGSDVEMTASNIADGWDFVGWKSGTVLLSTGTTFTISNLSSAQVLTAEASNLFDATVTLAGATSHTIQLSASGASLTGAISGTGSNPCTFSGLTRGSTYYVFDNGTYTGKTVTKNEPNVMLQYYTVSLTDGTGIDNTIGGGTYLAGSTVTVSASADSSHVFSSWSDGSAQNPYTIINLSSDKTLTANAALSFTGTVDIANGTIIIENDVLNSGKIRIMQGGNILVGGDNLDPKTNIIITGSYSSPGGISVTATYGAYITLKNVTISGTTDLNGCVDIADTAGNVTINLDGNNTLTGGSARAGIYKGMGSNTLTITGSGSLTATGGADGVGQGAAGIGGAFLTGAQSGGNIIITGGNITATGNGSGAGIGGGRFGNSGNITISGGTVIANGNGGGAGIGGGLQRNSGIITITGGTITATGNPDNWNYSGAGIGGGTRGSSGSVSITGGTIIAIGKGTGAGIGGGSGNSAFQPGSSGSVTISGGTITATSNGGAGIGRGGADINFGYGTATAGTITITGGNIKASMDIAPVGSNGKSLTLEETPWSGVPTIVDNRGIDYGMNDVQAIEDKMYAYVDRNGYYTVTTPARLAQSGVTATANITSSSGLSSNDTITVTITLSGTAQKPGTYTVGLTGTGIGSVAPQTLNATKGQSINASKTFSFTMPASDVTDLGLTLSFSESDKHTVSYYNGSTLLGSAAYYAGDTYTLMDGSGLNKTGYTFGGWGVSGDQTMGTSDVIRTAVWTPNTYKVVFHNDSATTEQSLTYNAAATALNGSVTKPGYTLSGWATSSGGPKVYSVNAAVQNLTAVQNGTVDLYAVWQAQSCSVSFASGGGTGAMEPQSLIHGVAQELTPNGFARTGYTFTGWTDGATTYVDGQNITATGNITLTAQWAVNSYRVVFNGNGAIGGTTMANESFSYDAAPKSLTANTFTRGGYTFAGWATTSSGPKAYDNGQAVQNLTASQNSTVTLYAVWTPNTYSVSFNAGTGSGTMNSQTHTYDAAQALTGNAFTCTGYSFSGWNTEADGTGLNYADEASVINLAMTGSVTLYAQWTADTYSLAFNSNNGVGSMDNQDFATGDSGTVSANRFVKPGYTFDGWNTKADGSGTNYAADANLMSLNNLTDASPTLYAKWSANNYTVSFNANGGTGSMADQSFAYNVPENLTANSFARGSDTFLGWSTSATAETAAYTNGQSVSNLSTIADGKVTLYAVWRANTYEVRFDANGGSGDMLPQTIGRSDTTSLNTNAFTRIGYSFAGWNTNINGSGVSYANGYQVTNLPGDSASSITLYAQWTESVRYNLNGTVKESGGALQSGATVKLMQGSVIVAQTMTGADGIYFFGNLKSGSYNVVATKDGRTVTKLVAITGNLIQDMVIPAGAANNSVLIVTNEPSADNIALTVGGLDDLASLESADITMTVTAKAEDDGDGEQNAIKEKSGSQAVGIYLDMTVKMGSVTQISTSNVLEIVIPLDFNGKTDINVYRYHGGQAVALNKLTDKPIAPFTDGNFYLDSANGLIYVYASEFSTYAVTYTGVSSVGSGGGGGGGASAHTVKIDTAGIMGGSVKADKTTAVSGEKVTITVTPDKDHKLTGLSVIDAGGKQITFTDNGDGTYTFAMPASAVTVRLFFGTTTDSTFPFVDVSETHWARKAIAWANDNGLFSGTSGTTFGPGISTTRGMVVTVLWRMEKEPSIMQDTAFADVSADAYYGKAVDWANKDGVVLGYGNGLFGPGNTITREQMAAILYRYAQLKGYNVSKRIKLDSFTDGGKTAGYAQTAMEWAAANSLISGKENNILDPSGNATRAEVAVMLMRFTELSK